MALPIPLPARATNPASISGPTLIDCRWHDRRQPRRARRMICRAEDASPIGQPPPAPSFRTEGSGDGPGVSTSFEGWFGGACPHAPHHPFVPADKVTRQCSFGSASKLAIASADNPVLELPTMREVLQPQDSPFKSSNNSGGGFGAHRLLQARASAWADAMHVLANAEPVTSARSSFRRRPTWLTQQEPVFNTSVRITRVATARRRQ